MVSRLTKSVTFRAKVHDRAQATAREAIYYIEQWITSSDVVTIPVHHARLTINNTCVVLIASFNDPECLGYLMITAQPTTSSFDAHNNTVAIMTSIQITTVDQIITGTQDQNKMGTHLPMITSQHQAQSDTGAIVGGTVAIVFIITAGVVILFLPHIILKNHHTTKFQR